MSRSRRFGSFCRHAFTRRRACGGSSAQSGSRVNTVARMSDTVSPAKSWRPVSISHSTTPNAQMSARLSTALPRACSGDM